MLVHEVASTLTPQFEPEIFREATSICERDVRKMSVGQSA